MGRKYPWVDNTGWAFYMVTGPGEIPTVYRWPYDYIAKPGHDEDFIYRKQFLFSETMNSNMTHDFEDNPGRFRRI